MPNGYVSPAPKASKALVNATLTRLAQMQKNGSALGVRVYAIVGQSIDFNDSYRR